MTTVPVLRRSRTVPLRAASVRSLAEYARLRGIFLVHRVSVRGRPRLGGRGGLRLAVSGEMRVGSSFRIRASQFPVQITVREGAHLSIGDDVFLNQGTNILAAAGITIGDHFRMGDLASIRDSDAHEVDPSSGVKSSPVRIGRNVWIGRQAVVMPGVTIGDHAVIAAGAIVTSDVESCSIVGGIPAREIRRFSAPPNWVRK
jgi:acetyltransferase-like isoleucine patch superfamily enzyme